MSLTSFLKNNQDVRARFRQEFKKPRFAVKKDLLAPALTKRYSLIGTAFDYLMRFHLKHLNPDAVTSRWIAELAVNKVIEAAITAAGLEVVYSAETGETWAFDKAIGEIPAPVTDETRKVKQIVEQAKEVYNEYLSSGEITDKLIESSLLLAQLDPIFRAGYIDENIGTVYEKDVTDLRNLISIVDPDTFRAKQLCMLNPNFGEASMLVGGADADLVIDDTLIEIKTTKRLELQRSHFDQLMGYYTLHEIAGVGELRPKPEIKKVAVYFSRHAYLHILDLHEIIDKHTFPDFVQWFIDRASEEQ